MLSARPLQGRRLLLLLSSAQPPCTTAPSSSGLFYGPIKKRLKWFRHGFQSVADVHSDSMSNSVTAKSLEPVLRAVAAKGLICDTAPSADLFDLDYFEARIGALMIAFPEDHFTHAAALKANSMRGVLAAARDKGMGAECASISEAIHALSLGFKPETVIYDSPCKTKVANGS